MAGSGPFGHFRKPSPGLPGNTTELLALVAQTLVPTEDPCALCPCHPLQHGNRVAFAGNRLLFYHLPLSFGRSKAATPTAQTVHTEDELGQGGVARRRGRGGRGLGTRW